MAKKELTELDYYKLDARNLIEHLNQLIKLLGPMFYLTHNGKIYIKSEFTHLERFAEYVDDSAIPSRFCGAMYDSIALSDFKTAYRVSKMVLIPYEDGTITIGQENDAVNPDAKLSITKLVPKRNNEEENETLKSLIFPEFYRKMPSIITQDIIDGEFTSISEDDMDDMRDGEMIIVEGKKKEQNVYAYITKETFPNIKKVDRLDYQILDVRNELDNKCWYILYREYIKSEKLYLYTLTAAYQNI